MNDVEQEESARAPLCCAAAALWHSGPQKKASPQLMQHIGVASSLPHARQRCPAPSRFQFMGRLPYAPLEAPLEAIRSLKLNGSESSIVKALCMMSVACTDSRIFGTGAPCGPGRR